MHAAEGADSPPAHPSSSTVIVREYGRDSLLIWANFLLAPLFAAVGLRIGLRSEEQLAARIEADVAAMRQRGYLVASVQVFSVPGIAGRRTDATWYRVTYERASTSPS